MSMSHAISRHGADAEQAINLLDYYGSMQEWLMPDHSKVSLVYGYKQWWAVVRNPQGEFKTAYAMDRLRDQTERSAIIYMQSMHAKRIK